MQKIFDVLVIGSGPIAFSALSSLPDGINVAVVTGSDKNINPDFKNIHPKILSEAGERNEKPGICETIHFDGYPGGSVSSTAAIGGLGNYWGQQYIAYQKNDSWPKNLFLNFNEYKNYCREVASSFEILGNEFLENIKKPGVNYSIYYPKLLQGTIKNKNLGLLTFKNLVENTPVNSWYNQGIYRVRIGPYVKRAEAELVAANVKKALGVNTYIIDQP